MIHGALIPCLLWIPAYLLTTWTNMWCWLHEANYFSWLEMNTHAPVTQRHRYVLKKCWFSVQTLQFCVWLPDNCPPFATANIQNIHWTNFNAFPSKKTTSVMDFVGWKQILVQRHPQPLQDLKQQSQARRVTNSPDRHSDRQLLITFIKNRFWDGLLLMPKLLYSG